MRGGRPVSDRPVKEGPSKEVRFQLQNKVFLVEKPANAPVARKLTASSRVKKKAGLTKCFQAVLFNLVSSGTPQDSRRSHWHFPQDSNVTVWVQPGCREFSSLPRHLWDTAQVENRHSKTLSQLRTEPWGSWGLRPSSFKGHFKTFHIPGNYLTSDLKC